MLTLVPVVVVSGPEDLLAERAVDEAVSAARQANPDVDVTEVDAAGLDLGTFLELVSPSLFGEARVLVIRQAAAQASCQDAIIEYVGAPEPDVTLIVVHDGGQRGRKIVDAARAGGATVIDCGKLTRFEDRLDFVRSEVRRAGGRIDAGGARALLDAVGSDLRELAAAAGQLVLDAEGEVDAETVRRYHSGRADAKGWAVADRALEGRGPAAMEELRWVLELGTEPVLVIGSLATGIRNVAAVASRSRESDAAIAKAVGLPAWKVRSVRSQARGWTPEGVAAALRAVADADVEVKGGGAHPAYALERAVRRIVEARVN
jgi:DNA polymerase-3 subunit delta